MQMTTLGRTGLSVSVAGLGGGGHSRLGQASGADPAKTVNLVHEALDLGVNLIDSAPVYGTEEVIGRALAGRRQAVVLSTKSQVVKPGSSLDGHDYISGAELAKSIDDSLTRLRTDYVDLFHLHTVMVAQYSYCLDELVPVLLRAREQGKVRFLGVTERFVTDAGHAMLTRALEDDLWDVMMVGFNLINPSARARVFAATAARNIGALIMFAVRRALSDPAALRELIGKLIADGLVAGDRLDPDDPLGFLVADGSAESVVEAAYRFCRHEPGADVVLTGTGSLAHLRDNLVSLQKGPLAAPAQARLRALFGAIDSVSGN